MLTTSMSAKTGGTCLRHQRVRLNKLHVLACPVFPVRAERRSAWLGPSFRLGKRLAITLNTPTSPSDVFVIDLDIAA